MVILSQGSDTKNDGTFSKIIPTVIYESDHPIRKQDIDREALKVLFRLRDAGFSGYLVGGGVRDLYLGKKPKDFDISTDAKPGQLRRLFRNSRTIGRRFRLVQIFFHGGKIIEVSTLRSQSEYDINETTEVLPSNNSFGTLEEDAFRRDLTINSLFYEIENNTIIDFVGGVKDLDAGIARIVGEPDSRVTRDPVRIMRAVRHAARNDFQIEEKSWKAIIHNCHKLNLCPTSRIRDEFLKDMRGGASLPWLELSLQCGLFETIFPFYKDIFAGKHGEQVRDELRRIFKVFDRYHQSEGFEGSFIITDHMLFAIILFPWASRRFDLTPRKLMGSMYHDLSRQIRSLLDEMFARRLNIKRGIKESMTTLLVNFPSMQIYHMEKNYPPWLKKKSYFDDCSRFLAFFDEANGGEKVDRSLFVEQQVLLQPDVHPVYSNNGQEGAAKGRRNIMPAFSSSKEGVFGLRNITKNN